MSCVTGTVGYVSRLMYVPRTMLLPVIMVFCVVGIQTGYLLGGTVIERLEPDQLRDWLAEYRLGEIWRMGEIGGNRW